MFMPAAATDATDAAPVAPPQPDPPRAVPEHVGRVLCLVRTFIAYGKKLADTLRQHADNPHGFPGFFSVATIFRTVDLTIILDRIARGLLRAAALEARLERLAARGRDLTPSPVRMPASRKPAAAETITSIDNRADDPAPEAADLAPMPLPTSDDIIARDRRRPIGAVLVDICHDLGIAPDQVDRTTWDELLHYVIGYGGSLVTLLFKRPLGAGQKGPDAFRGYFIDPTQAGLPGIPLPAWPAPSLAPAGTGPP